MEPGTLVRDGRDSGRGAAGPRPVADGQIEDRRDRVRRICAALVGRLHERRAAVLECLTAYETWGTARDEFARAVRTVENIDAEWEHLSRVKVGVVASLLPVNQPLYALVLFGVVPALVTDRVVVRPSVSTAPVIKRLWRHVAVSELADRLRIVDVDRAAFLRDHVSTCDAAIVTGTHRTARAVMDTVRPGAVVVFNGSGVNPIVVMPDGDLDRAARAVVEVGMYNSGQDCAAPNCVLVHRDVASNMVDRLRSGMRALRVGDNRDPTVDIGPVARRSSIDGFVDFVSRHADRVVTGGDLDVAGRLLTPTLVVSSFGPDFHYPELYAPVVNVGIFHEAQDVAAWAAGDRYQRHAMYATVYGYLGVGLRNTILLPGETVLDHEDGNRPFGGFGSEASFVKRGGARPVRGPVLVSAALATAGEAPS